jgi:hypothetical protein
MGVDEHDLSQQFAMLESYVETHAADASGSGGGGPPHGRIGHSGVDD